MGAKALRGATPSDATVLWKADGAIKADDKQLAKLVKANSRQWAEIKDTLWPLFEIKAGMLTHPGTTIEIEKAKANREKKRLAGIASGASRQATSVQQRSNCCSTNAELRADKGQGEDPDQRGGEWNTVEDDRPLRLIRGGDK